VGEGAPKGQEREQPKPLTLIKSIKQLNARSKALTATAKTTATTHSLELVL